MYESEDNSLIEDTSQSEVIENDISNTTQHSNKENSNANVNSPQIQPSSPKTIYTKLSEQMMNNFLKTGKFTYNYDTLVKTKETNNGSKTSKNKKIASSLVYTLTLSINYIYDSFYQGSLIELNEKNKKVYSL